MQSIDLILKSEAFHIQKQHICYPDYPDIEYIYLCNDEPLTIREQSAYLGTSRQIADLLSLITGDYPVLFLVTDCPEEFWELAKQVSCNLLFIPQPLLELHNRLNDIICSYRRWQHTFQIMTFQSEAPLSFLKAGSEMLGCATFLINSGYSLIACHNEATVTHPVLNELMQKGFLTVDSFVALKDAPEITLLPIRKGVSIIAFLILPEATVDAKLPYRELLFQALKVHLSQSVSASAINSRIEFEQLVHDLIDLNMNTKEEIIQRLGIINLQIHHPFCCVVIQAVNPTQSTRPMNPMIPKLQKIFSEGHFCIYQRSIIGILPVNNYRLPQYNEPALLELLSEWDSAAGFSNSSSHLEHFRSFYLMSLQALRFGLVFGHETESTIPIYHYEEYRIYHIIDMCKESFVRIYHHDNLIYLCHPHIIALYRYDQEHNSDLLHVLSTYLKLDCNIAQAARELNFHRNTMANKISKIEEFLGITLNDTVLKQTLVLSYMTLRYISEYLKKDIFSYQEATKSEYDSL